MPQPESRIMKYCAVLAAALLCLTPRAYGQLLPSLNASAYRIYCRVDDEIPQADRSQGEKAALDLAQNALSGNADQVYALMAKEAQTKIGPENIAKLTGIIKATGPFQNVHVAHSYFIEVTGGGDKLPPSDCYKNSDGPERATIAVRPVPRQFHVEVVAHTINNDWSIFVWLAPENDALKVLSFNFATAAISGHDAQDLMRLAREQNAKGHTYSAAFLLQAAGSVSSRGPNAMPFWKSELDKEVKAFVPPKEFTGKPPYQWHVGDQTFELLSGGVIGVGGNLDLVFDRKLASWSDNAATDADNKTFVTAIVKAYPEFSESFRAIIAKAEKPDGTGGFTTVYEFEKGFSQGK
jgi:hypothetical protein